jgi:hypothetical protein
MKKLTILLAVLLPLISFSQSPGDTIVIPTFNYTQTQSPQGRDSMILFPDDPGTSYEKIIMAYNMRCKNGLVSNGTNTNLGCGEWDYSCNTYIYDSTRVDSVRNYLSSHTITHFSGSAYGYVEEPTFTYYQHLQKEVTLNSVISENQNTVGAGNVQMEVADGSFSGKAQFLYTQAELSQAGVSAGNLDGIILNALSNSELEFLRVKLKHTTETSLNNSTPQIDGFTEVYFMDYPFVTGENRIQFHTPFTWDGTSNIVVEYSFTNEMPANQLVLQGEDFGVDYGLIVENGTHIINDVGYTQIPTEPLSSISNEITVSCWVNGSEEYLPAQTYIFSGVDNANNRQLSCHLPWSNSSVYFDCGFADGSYDRIEKAATPEEIKGQWNHWAFTKNTATGDMKIYLNGELWQSGTGKTKPINIQDLVLGDTKGGSRNFFGKIDELRIWDKELDQATISGWMNVEVDNSHPNYGNLVAYYKFDEGTGTSAADASVFGETAEIFDYVTWSHERGDKLSREFEVVTERPNTTFLQGNYDLTISDVIATETVENLANVVTEFEIIPRYGTMLNDSINEVYTSYFWQAGYEYIYGPDGLLADSIEVVATGNIEITELNYYTRYPSKYQLMSFVTPYGIYLDLGMEGKTWFFDVTDYAPVLKGWRRMTMENGGQRQEDIDIRFWFIEGTPPRDVIDINQIWRPASSGYQNIMDDRTFEARDFKMNPEGAFFKVKSVITGHGQQGEFTPRWHTLNIDGGDVEYEWKVWTECSTIPVYPQGGTWLYDRAGWCPGDPSDMYEYDITEYVSPGQVHNIDYSVTIASGTSNYLVNNQLVTYGTANFTIDAAVINVTKPNASAAHQRFNPACTQPMVVIQNTGGSTLTSLDIEYNVEGGEVLTYNWTGSLAFLETAEVELPIPDFTFWSGDDNMFKVNISNANGQTDEYPYNNHFEVEFEEVPVHDVFETFTIECKTNLQGYQTSYSLTDLDGNVILEMSGLENSTIYSNEVTLPMGCYRLRIDDTGDNGLYYWHTPNYGTGYFRLKKSSGFIIENFEPEFGRFAVYEFGIVDFTGIEDSPDEASIVSIFPNPATDHVTINLKGLKNSEVKIEIFSATNLKVYDNQFKVSGTDFTENIKLKNLVPGMYILRLEHDGKVVNRKIVMN